MQLFPSKRNIKTNGGKFFEDWKSQKGNTRGLQEYSSLQLVELEKIENLVTALQEMKAKSINFWLGKFLQEVRDENGQRYPGKTSYQIIAALKRYLERKGRTDINILSKVDTGYVKNVFILFCKSKLQRLYGLMV